jgi:hypothetical protein
MRMKNRLTYQGAGITIILVIISLTGLLIFSSCLRAEGQPPPPGSPDIKITAPVDGAAAGEVTVSVDISNFKLVQGSSRQGEGLVMYYLDTYVPTYYYHPAITTGGTYAARAETSYTWENVPPGPHTFSAQLVNNDNGPMPIPAVATVTVNIGAPQGSPGLKITSPEDGSELPPGMIIIIAEASSFIISEKDMGPVNRPGSGHFIYYMDEKPPTDQGQPALTDNSIVSTALIQRWKSITEGTHTFAVQLVNNDDTPLDPPVTASATLSIKPGE